MFKKGLAVILALCMLPLSVGTAMANPYEFSDSVQYIETNESLTATTPEKMQPEDITINSGNLQMMGNEYSIYNFTGKELTISSSFPVFSFSLMCDSSIVVDTAKTEGNVFVKDSNGTKFYYFTVSPGLLENSAGRYYYTIHFTNELTPTQMDTVIGISTQNGTPTPDKPIPIESNVPAGKYHIETDGKIYEFILPSDLHGFSGYNDTLTYKNGSLMITSYIDSQLSPRADFTGINVGNIYFRSPIPNSISSSSFMSTHFPFHNAGVKGTAYIADSNFENIYIYI